MILNDCVRGVEEKCCSCIDLIFYIRYKYIYYIYLEEYLISMRL